MKNLGTVGDGGMVVTRDEILARRIAMLRQYGWSDKRSSLMPGWNSRLGPLEAAILELSHLPEMVDARRQIAARHDVNLADLNLVLPREREGSQHAFHLYVMRCKDGTQRDKLLHHLRARGVVAGIHYPVPVHLQPAYRGRVDARALAHTETIAHQIISLPIYPELTAAQQKAVNCRGARLLRGPRMTPITIRSMRRIAFRQHHTDGTLTVFPAETTGVPFSIRRVFTISGVSTHGARGNHAHRDCSQMLACLSGQIVVTVHDGFETTVETVDDDGVSLLIPPMLWNSVRFDGPSTVLAVFCDELYDADDYITDWNEFVHLKAAERATIQQSSKS